MNEEMNKELKGQVAVQEVAPEETAVEKIITEKPAEVMGDFAAEPEASYQTLNKRKIELTEGESSTGAKWIQFQQMMDDRIVVKVEAFKTVRGGVVTTLEEVCILIPASQLSTEYVGKLEDWQGKYMECTIITVDPEKKRLVLSGHEMEREKKEAEKKACMEQFKAGDVVEGAVDNIKPYGVFVKLADGVDELLYISRVSAQRTEHPGAVLTEGQTVKVRTFSMKNRKLNLSMRVLSRQTAECEEHETFDYEGTGPVSTRLGDLLKGPKL